VDTQLTPPCPDSPGQKKLSLVVALGNPGAEYAETLHNAGWLVVAELLKRHQAKPCLWQPSNGELLECEFGCSEKSEKILLLKPLTYMNRSGYAVVEVLEHFLISPEEMLVVCDCLDLPEGRMRLRLKGSSSGQRGVQSIIDNLGTETFPRLRVGIGRPESPEASIVDYVLSRVTSEDHPGMQKAFEAAALALERIVTDGFEASVQFCNGWRYHQEASSDEVQTL